MLACGFGLVGPGYQHSPLDPKSAELRHHLSDSEVVLDRHYPNLELQVAMPYLATGGVTPEPIYSGVTLSQGESGQPVGTSGIFSPLTHE